MPNPNNNSVQDKFITLENLERYNNYVYPGEMSWDEYQEIEPEEGKTYFIYDYDAGQSAEAVDVTYDNTSSELQADNVQDAIDELKDLVDNIEDNNTTYTLSVGTGADANKIVLTPSTGNPDKVTVPYATNAGTVNSHTVASDVPADAVFTDTTYSDATTSASGLMSASDKSKVDGLGTASTKDVATSGNASATQVVMGNDTRLTDARNAADVSAWAKASTKPSYTAAEVGAIATTAKGANGGVAELDSTGKVPASQLPSFVDDVKEYNSISDFPLTGETDKIYVAKDTNKTYRWSGTDYVEISESLALGETSSTAYAGNKGKANADAIAAIKDGTDIDSFGDVETAISTLQSNFQDGVDSVYDAVVAKGSTPASKSLSDVVTGIANIPNANSGTYSATTRESAIDMGQANTYRYVNTNSVPNTNAATYDVTSNGIKDMGATNDKRYVNVAVPNTNAATYDVTSNGIKDMGATNDKRYVNVSVANSNSGTYTYASGSTGGTVDMGATNSYRYVNATNVYNKGKADGVTTHTTTYTPTSRASNNDMGATHTYRYVNTNSVPNSNSGTYTPAGNAIYDMGATNDKRYCDGRTAYTAGYNAKKAELTATYTPTSRSASLDMGANHGYRYVNTNSVPNSNSGTYGSVTSNGVKDMGATNSYRYCNINVPNSNSGTYTYASGSTGGTVDMGASNSYRYVNATNVYNKGKADGAGSVTYSQADVTSSPNQISYTNQGKVAAENYYNEYYRFSTGKYIMTIIYNLANASVDADTIGVTFTSGTGNSSIICLSGKKTESSTYVRVSSILINVTSSTADLDIIPMLRGNKLSCRQSSVTVMKIE